MKDVRLLVLDVVIQSNFKLKLLQKKQSSFASSPVPTKLLVTLSGDFSPVLLGLGSLYTGNKSF